MAEPIRGFTTRAVCDLAGVAPSTLNSWASGESPLVVASILGSYGKRNDRYWSVRDLVMVRTIKALRQAGCPLQQLRKASEVVQLKWGEDLRDLGLYWDGADIVATDSWGTIRSLVQHPGQQMLHIVAVPLAEWRIQAEANPLFKDIDVPSIVDRRSRRAGGKRSPELAQSLVVEQDSVESPGTPPSDCDASSIEEAT
jgi:DNA-binding transcriptional MerR regulator